MMHFSGSVLEEVFMKSTQQQQTVKWLLYLSSSNVVKAGDNSHPEQRIELASSVGFKGT